MQTCKDQLDSLKEEIKETNATLTSPKSNINYIKLSKGKAPIYSLMIPNKLFPLWQKYRELQGQIGQQPSSFIALATYSVHGISLKADAEALEKRLQSESSRFRANYRKKGGPARKAFLSRNINILLMEDEILPASSTDALAESTASTAAAANNIDITVTTQLQLNTSTATNSITTTANTTTTSDTATTTDAGSTVTTTAAAAAVATAMNRFATASTTTTASVHVLPSSSTTMTDVTMMMTNAPIVTSANNLIVYTPAISRSTPMVCTVLSGSTVNLPIVISRSSPTISRNAPVTCSNIILTSSESSATVVSISSCTSSITNVPLLSTPSSTNTAIPASISTPVVQGNGAVASHVHMQTSSVLQLHGMLREYRTYVVNHVPQLAIYVHNVTY